MADKEKDAMLEDEDIDDTTGTEGTDGKDKDADQQAEATGKDDNGKKAERSFTQSQVKRMMTREKNQGRSAALKELGIDPSDSKMVKMVKALIESQKTDDQKAAEQSAVEQSKIAEAEAKAMRAEAKAEAMMLDVKAEFVDDIVTLAMAKMDDDGDLKTIIGEMKTKYPTMFKNGSNDDDEEGKDDKGKKGTGAAAATGKKGTGAALKGSKEKDKKDDDEKKGLGSRLAAQRRSATKKGTNFMKR